MTKRKEQILRKLAKDPLDVMKGSLAESYRPCGKPSCKRCQQGQFHHGYFFSFRVERKGKMVYIPKRYYSQVKKLNDRWKHHKDLIEELTEINVKLIREGKFPVPFRVKEDK